MSKRKYKQGKMICSMSNFEASYCTFFIVYFGFKPKTLHKSFLTSWQYRTLEKFIDNGWVFEAQKIMSKEEILEYVRNCPYSSKTIDSLQTCDLEFHYRKICPSSECRCAEKFGLKKESENE